MVKKTGRERGPGGSAPRVTSGSRRPVARSTRSMVGEVVLPTTSDRPSGLQRTIASSDERPGIARLLPPAIGYRRQPSDGLDATTSAPSGETSPPPVPSGVTARALPPSSGWTQQREASPTLLPQKRIERPSGNQSPDPIVSKRSMGIWRSAPARVG